MAQSSNGGSLVDAHLKALPEPQRSTLGVVRGHLLAQLPYGEECIKYRMPAITVQGKGAAAYDGFANHCSYFPMSGTVLEKVAGIPAWATVAKGTLQFPIDRPLSAALVRRLVKVRLAEISDVRNGKRFDFFEDGSVKAEGTMREGELHGAWRWYRRDGSLKRTGRFNNGEQIGTWETYAADGTLVTATRF